MVARLLFTALTVCALSASPQAADRNWRSQPLASYLQYLEVQGLRVIYSTSLVTPDLVLTEDPPPGVSVDALREVLRNFELAADAGPGGVWLVVASPGGETASAASGAVAVDEQPLPEIVVSSSVYSIQYQRSGSHTFLEREFAAGLPDVGEETLSVIARVPGIANGGVSSRSNVRGGANNEQLIVFDGLRLYEPFHLKDFHAITSIIDQRAIDGIEFYTAAYQARYGDRMSGVVDIGLRDRPDKIQTELGLSFFTTSLLSTGRFANDKKGDWLVSARRGNLDLITRAVREEYGQPEYHDLFAHFGWEWSDRTSLAFNYLYSRDNIVISQLDESENAVAGYRNNIGWFKLETDWTPNVSMSTILSATDISNSRSGQSEIPGIVSGSASDSRSFSLFAIKQDWTINASDRWLFRSGFDVKVLDSNYVYDSALTIFSPFDQILDNAPFLQRSVRAKPEGEQYALYAETRWKLTEKLIIDLGFRFDRQTYSVAETNEQRSPRFNLLYRLGSRTELRAGAGRFYQAQEINELQYADGVAEFSPPQVADHFVASLSHRFQNELDLRIEIYQKVYHSLLTRFENVFNPLVLLPELQIDRARIDADRAYVNGAELTLSGSYGEGSAHWWTSYAWSSTEDRVLGQDARRAWDQKHAVQAGISATLGKWDISAAATWHSGWPKTELYLESVPDGAGNPLLVATTSARNSLDFRSFHTLDARASRTFQLAHGELEVFIEVSNIYNHENQCCLSYSLSADESGNPLLRSSQDFWLPLVPSLGVVWKF